MSPSEEIETLQKRVASRAVILCGRGKVDSFLAILSRDYQKPSEYLRIVDGMLKAIWEFYAIVARLLPRALKELNQVVRAREVRALVKPVGPVQWQKTIRARLQSQTPTSSLELICHQSYRTPLAPENVLLIVTLVEVAEHAQRLQRRGLLELSQSEVSFLIALKREVARALAGEACQGLLQAAEAALARADVAASQLETAVEKRLSGSRAVAPVWAADLLSYRRRRKLWMPPELDQNDPRALYSTLALYEVIIALSEGAHASPRGGPRQFPDGMVGLGIQPCGARDGASLQARCHVLRVETQAPVLVVPLYVLGQHQRFTSRLSSLDWTARDFDGRSFSRWLVFQPVVGRGSRRRLRDGLDCLLVHAPTSGPKSASFTEIFAWLAQRKQPAASSARGNADVASP